MKTVLKVTKRFAAVFLALAMVVLSLPSTLMEVQASAAATITAGTLVEHLTVATDTASWSANDAENPENVIFTAKPDVGYSFTKSSALGSGDVVWQTNSGTAVTGTENVTAKAATYTVTKTNMGTYSNTASGAIAQTVSGLGTGVTIEADQYTIAKDDGPEEGYSANTNYTVKIDDVELSSQKATFGTALTFTVDPVGAGNKIIKVAYDVAANTDDGNITHPAISKSTTGVTIADGTASVTIPEESVYGDVTIYALVGNTAVTASEPENASVEITGTQVNWSAGATANTGSWLNAGDLTITYSLADPENYDWGNAPSTISKFSIVDSQGSVTTLSNTYAELSYNESTKVGTLTLKAAAKSAYAGSDFRTITINTTASAVSKADGISVSPSTYSQSVTAGQSIVSKKFTATLNAGGTASWGIYEDNEGVTKATIPGLTLSVDGNTATLSGAPTTQKAQTTYYIIAYTDLAGGKLGYSAFDLTVTNAKAGIQVVDENEDPIANPVLAFGSKKVGYSAVTGKSFTVMNTTSNPIPIDSIEMDGADKDAYELSVSGLDGTSLGAGEKAVVTVTPKTGLGANAYITANVIIKSTAFDENKEVATATFTVIDDISVTVNGSPAVLTETKLHKTDDGSTALYYDIDLGTYKVGETIPDISVRATESGAAQELKWNTGAADGTEANTINKTLKDDVTILGLGTSSIKNEGVSGSTSYAQFTLTASKTLAQGAYAYSATNVTNFTNR